MADITPSYTGRRARYIGPDRAQTFGNALLSTGDTVPDPSGLWASNVPELFEDADPPKTLPDTASPKARGDK